MQNTTKIKYLLKILDMSQAWNDFTMTFYSLVCTDFLNTNKHAGHSLHMYNICLK